MFSLITDKWINPQMEEEWLSLLWMFKKDNKYVLNNIWMISMIFTTNFDNAVIRRWKLSLMKKEEEAPKQWPSFPNCLPHFFRNISSASYIFNEKSKCCHIVNYLSEWGIIAHVFLSIFCNKFDIFGITWNILEEEKPKR